jgi:hypothetical protein
MPRLYVEISLAYNRHGQVTDCEDRLRRLEPQAATATLNSLPFSNKASGALLG